MRSDLWSIVATGMSRKALLATAISLPLAGLGCEHHHHRDEVVVHERIYADEAPPVDRVEVVTVRPSPDHIWVKGHYLYHSGRYEWVGGRWSLPPNHERVWEAGRWDREGNRYVWIEGRWR